ncbi:MAG: hypothetical protein ACR2I4_08820 [Actinomycetota bacterium]
MHRAAAVDDQSEVERGPLLVHVRCWCVEIEHGVDHVLPLNGDELVVELDAGLHWVTPLLIPGI